MGEDVSPLGRIATLHFYDGTDVQYVGPGSGHRLPVDVESIVLPADAATETTLASLLTEVGQKLETADLSIGAVTKWLEVIVMSSVLPTGAATQTTLAGIQALIGALSNPDAGTMNKHLLDLVTRLGAVGGGGAGTALAYLLEIQARLGDETAPAAGTLAKLLTDLLTAAQIIDGYANPDNTLFGYNAVYTEQVVVADSPGGTVVLNASTVDSGEVWVVEQITFRDVNTAPSRLEWVFYDGSTSLVFKATDTLSANVTVEWTGQLHLSYGMKIQASAFGTVLHDVLYLEIMGYKMKV